MAKFETEDGVLTPVLVIENGFVLGVAEESFQTKEGQEQTYTEAIILVGLEVYRATVNKGVGLIGRTVYPRLIVEVKGVGRMGGGHDVRFRVLGTA